MQMHLLIVLTLQKELGSFKTSKHKGNIRRGFLFLEPCEYQIPFGESLILIELLTCFLVVFNNKMSMLDIYPLCKQSPT